MMISNVRGGFQTVRGTILYDPQDAGACKLHAEIDVNTINTQDASRDAHLKGPDFFDTAQYPVMTFESTKVENIGDDQFKITGNLTLHGTTKPVVLTVDEVGREVKDPWGNLRMGAHVTGKLNRKDFGLSWSAPMETGGVLVGDEVKIEMDIEAVRAQSAAA